MVTSRNAQIFICSLKKIFLFLFLVSCSTYNKINIKEYNIEIFNSNISNIFQKKVLNELINNSSFTYNQFSNFILSISINEKQRESVYSKNISVELYNTKYSINYEILDKTNNKTLKKGRFVVIADKFIGQNRFVNYRQNDYIDDNVVKNIVIKLENKLK